MKLTPNEINTLQWAFAYPLWDTMPYVIGVTIEAHEDGQWTPYIVVAEDTSDDNKDALWFEIGEASVLVYNSDTALSEKAGQVIWKQSLSVPSLSIRGNSRALFLDGVLLYTTGKGRLTLLSAQDGKPVLDAPVSAGRGITAVERVADLLATPTVRNGVLFLSAYRQETLAIQLADGALLWKSDKATALDLFADNRYVYVVDKNSIIYALDIRSGKVAWQSAVAEGRKISPLAGNGQYLVSVDNQGKLLVLDSANGELLGYQDVGDDRTYVAPQWVDGKWLTFTGNGQLTLSEIR